MDDKAIERALMRLAIASEILEQLGDIGWIENMRETPIARRRDTMRDIEVARQILKTAVSEIEAEEYVEEES